MCLSACASFRSIYGVVSPVLQQVLPHNGRISACTSDQAPEYMEVSECVQAEVCKENTKPHFSRQHVTDLERL